MIAIIYLSSFVNFLNKFNFNFIVINVSLTLNSLHCVSNNIVSAMQCNTMMSIIFIIPRFIMLKYEVFGTFMTGVFKVFDSTGGSLLHTPHSTFINLKFHSIIISYFISCLMFYYFYTLLHSYTSNFKLLSSLLLLALLLALLFFYYFSIIINFIISFIISSFIFIIYTITSINILISLLIRLLTY